MKLGTLLEILKSFPYSRELRFTLAGNPEEGSHSTVAQFISEQMNKDPTDAIRLYGFPTIVIRERFSWVPDGENKVIVKQWIEMQAWPDTFPSSPALPVSSAAIVS